MACARAIRASSWSMFDSPLQPTRLATSKSSGTNNLGIAKTLSLMVGVILCHHLVKRPFSAVHCFERFISSSKGFNGHPISIKIEAD